MLAHKIFSIKCSAFDLLYKVASVVFSHPPIVLVFHLSSSVVVEVFSV